MQQSYSPTPQENRETKPSTKLEVATGNEPTPIPSEDALDNELKARGNRQALLVEVNATLAGAIDAEAVLGEILSRFRERTRITHASIYLLDPNDHLLRCAAESGYVAPEGLRMLALDGPGLIAWAARSATAAYVPDVSEDPRYLCGDPKIKSEYVVPLLARSRVLGVLDIESDQLDGIRAATAKLADQFAPQAALAIERSDLYKKLQASEERFRSIFEQNSFGVALWSLEGKFSAVNPAFARLLGYDPHELLGKPFPEVTHPEDRERGLALSKALLEGKEDHFALEKRYVHKSGETVWGNTVTSVIRDAEGHPAYTLAMIQDITERKEAEEERARLQEQLFQAQKMEAIGTLTGGIAHDFNNFLGVILGFASVLRLRLPPDDPLLEPVSVIEQSATSAADLTRQLLGLARPEKYRPKPVSVSEVLNRVMQIVRRTFDRRIGVDLRLASALPWVEADAVQLQQAILNLAINARDAMPEGGTLTLETSALALGPDDPLRPAHCPPGEYVRVAVRDTGTGMEPEVIERVFEPFFTTKEPGRGSGLGLTMVYGIVSNHGGFVQVESRVGRGSQFTIHLPAIPAGRVVESALRKKPAQFQYGSGTVLVVDDEPLVLAFAEEGLKRLGYKVVTAESGKRACEIYASRMAEIDYVLLDIVMPELSGLEACRKLRDMNPRVKVILSSGYSEGKAAGEALESGIGDFLGKPYTLETLSLVLKKFQRD